MLKTTYTEERSVHTNSKSCTTCMVKYLLNSKLFIQISQPKVIDYFLKHSNIVNMGMTLNKLVIKTVPIIYLFCISIIEQHHKLKNVKCI